MRQIENEVALVGGEVGVPHVSAERPPAGFVDPVQDEVTGDPVLVDQQFARLVGQEAVVIPLEEGAQSQAPTAEEQFQAGAVAGNDASVLEAVKGVGESHGGPSAKV